METTPFDYEVLPSATSWIRTLSIDSRSTRGKIICTLIASPLEDAHTCLSYTWGTQLASHQITVNDQVLLIRENLLHFLEECHRNQALVNVPLWIDAICINQADLLEKNDQVALMGKIYAQAKIVVVWLGYGDETVAEALRHVQAYVDSPFIDPDTVREQETVLTNGFTKNLHQTDYSGTPIRTYWNNFDAVANLPYWKRMWIVQELLLAKDSEIWYGHLRTRWWNLAEYYSFVENRAGPEGSNPNLGYTKTRRSSSAWLLRRLALNDEVPSASSILPFSISLTQLQQECFDKRDLVYGARALDKDLQSIPVDYESHACKLLPALFGSPAIKSDYVYSGLNIIDRLGLDIVETTRMTYSHLPQRTWPANILNIGLVLNGRLEDMNSIWETNWSAFAYQGRFNSSVQFNDGTGSVTLDTHSKSDSANTPDLKPGDMIFHITMVNLLLVFRNSNAVEQPSEQEQVSQDAISCYDMEQVAAAVATYKFWACFEITAKTADGQRPRLKGEYLNTMISPNDRTTDLASELTRSSLKVDIDGYRLMLDWRSLLRIWGLRDIGIAIYNPKIAETIGSWDEEEAKVKRQKLDS